MSGLESTDVASGRRTACGDHLDLRTGDLDPAFLAGCRGFWALATAFAIVQFGGTIPVPLYTLWRGQFPFSNGTLTVIFAIYAVGTLLALFLLAPLSDQLGRRPLLFGALALAALSTGLFLVAKSVDVLMAARFISGVATGCATATATAALRELQPPSRSVGRPHGDGRQHRWPWTWSARRWIPRGVCRSSHHACLLDISRTLGCRHWLCHLFLRDS